MLDNEPTDDLTTGTTPGDPTAADGGADQASDPPPAPAAKKAARKTTRTTKKAAGTTGEAGTPAKRASRKKAAAPVPDPAAPEPGEAAWPAADVVPDPGADEAAAPVRKTAARKTAKKATTRKTAAKRTTKKAAAEPDTPPEPAAAVPLFQAPEVDPAPRKTAKKAVRKTTRKSAGTKRAAAEPVVEETLDVDATEDTDELLAAAAAETPTVVEPEPEPETSADESTDTTDTTDSDDSDDGDDSDDSDDSDDGEGSGGGRRRRRRRGGRRRRKGSGGGDATDEGSDDADGATADPRADGEGAEATGRSDDKGETSDKGDRGEKGDDEDGGAGVTSKRRRRRRRAGDGGDDSGDSGDSAGDGKTVTRVRKARSAEDQITAVSGSTRLEAKKQRRREGREAGRRRAPIVSEAEFLARRESVDRSMVLRQHEDLTQIAVLEDGVLVEHYVARESQTSLIGNVYLGRVQNVLPSMEAAFVDIGKGRNAVLYAGEVNWSALGHTEGQPRKIESVLSSGQTVLVQVTKDPIGHKGARLTSQVSLAGRFLVYVPDGTTSGISRKLPDTERARLKALLKEIVPDGAGVIVRTAAEGATEEQLTEDVQRLTARWADIEKKTRGGAPQLLYGEPDLTVKVVRDLFTEDFSELLVEGDAAWDTVHGYVAHVAPDLEDRVRRFERGENGKDCFAVKRIDEQIAKGLDRKVWLPSGGSLIFDRTEAMTVVDVNTGKFTGSGGNLEETVTKNNLEAAEELVRQLRLRDIGGIVVVDFIDMVLESNRDLVLRRLVECLGRDRTRHQVAEVTSLGLVQLTRKRIGTGLLEAFSENCDHCSGRGLVMHDMPVETGGGGGGDEGRGRGRRRGGKGRNGGNNGGNGNDAATPPRPAPSPAYVAAVAKPENAERAPLDEEETADTAADTAAEDALVAGVADAAVPTAEPEVAGADEDVPEPEPTPEPVDTAPRTVTRTTRRRSAARPAGSPAGAQAAVVSVEPTEATPAASTPSEPVDAPPPPKVVTRTRGRGGRRTGSGGDEGAGLAGSGEA